MRVNQPDGTVRDEVVIVGGSGQAVGMNGDRLKVDANLNVDEVTVSNVGITSVDGAGMEQAGEYMPVKGEVQLTGSSTQQDYKSGTVVTAGSSAFIANIPASGNRLGIAVRLNAAAKFTLFAYCKNLAGAVVSSQKNVINQSSTATDRSDGTFNPNTASVDIYLQNNDVSDLTITSVSVTNFRS